MYKKEKGKKTAPVLLVKIMAGILLLVWATNSSQAQTADTTVRISEIITDEEVIVTPVQSTDEEGTGENEDDQYNAINRNFRPVYFNDSTGEMLTQRQVNPQVKDSFLLQNDFWYVNHQPEKKQSSGSRSSLGEISWLEPLLWIIIIGGFLVFIGWWYINNGQGSLFRRNPKTIDQDYASEEISEDIFAINYAAAISKAIAGNNYRLAVRLMYLQVLTNMHHNNIIRYKQDATNFDYLVQLHQTGYYPEFFKVTRHYEYAWYGLFPVNEQAFNVIKQDIEALTQKIGYR